MNRLEIDVLTGDCKVIELTAEELLQIQVQHQKSLDEQPTKEEQIAALQAQIDAIKESN
jgi:hypothetical protein